MSIQKRIKNLIDYCPQPSMPLATRLKRHSLPIAAAVTAILVLSVTFTIFAYMSTMPKPIPAPSITAPPEKISGIQTVAETGGNVSNPNGVISDLSGDNNAARIYGTGGYIIGDIGQVVPSIVFIEINATIAEGKPSTMHVFVNDITTGSWTEIGMQTVNGGPTWWSIGYVFQSFSQVKISCTGPDVTGPDVDLYIDAIKIIPPALLYEEG
jgi:hypothetical protein